MQTISFYEILKEIDYDLAEEFMEIGSDFKAKLTDECDADNIVAPFQDFFDYLGIKPDCYGYIIFDPESYDTKFISTPVFAGSPKGKLALYYGSNREYVECEFKNGKFYLGKIRLKLKQIVVNDSSRHFIIVETDNYEFVLSFVLGDKSKRYTPEYYESIWKGGTFQDILKDLSSVGGYGINLSKCFACLYDRGGIPMEGILLVLKNGKLSAYDDTNNGKTYISSSWELVTSSHPEIPVTDYYGNMISLKEAKYISISDTAQPSKYIKRISGGFYNGYYLLWIKDYRYVGKNSQLDWTPEHIGKKFDPNKIPPLFQRYFPKVLMEVKEANGNILETSVQKQLPGTGDKDFIEVEYEDVQKDIADIPF